MTEWKRKRFWSRVETVEAGDGFTIALDDRPVNTPSKSRLKLPSRDLAEAIAGEWAAQDGEVNPESMPLTRLANSALEKVAPQQGAVAAHLAEYGESDLLCYRAEGPEGLVARQEEHWGPLLGWAQQELGIRLDVQSGIMPIQQAEESRNELRRRTSALGPFDLTALHELVTLSGSWVIGYAALTEARAPQDLWQAAVIDEMWQEERWGEDEEASEHRQARRTAFLTAHRFAVLARET